MMKCKIDNFKVKNAYMRKWLVMLVGIALIASALAIILYRGFVNNKLKDESISFAQAYNEGRLDEKMYVNVEITDEPYVFAAEGETIHYYYVSDENGLYIMKATNEKYNDYINSINENGYARIVGIITEMEPELKEMAIEAYNEGIDEADQITREQFDNYFQDVVLFANAPLEKGGADYALICFFMIMGGILIALLGVVSVTNYSGTLGRMSEVEAMQIAAELDDERTVYIKKCRTYLTPNYIVSLGTALVAMPYANIRWAYRFNQSYNLIPCYTDIKLVGLNFQKVSAAQMFGFVFKKNDVVNQIFSTIRQHNPTTAFGYTQELINYFAMLQKQYRQQCQQMIKVS